MNQKAQDTINAMHKLLRLRVGHLGLKGARIDALRSAIEQVEQFEKLVEPLEQYLANEAWQFSEWLDSRPWEQPITPEDEEVASIWVRFFRQSTSETNVRTGRIYRFDRTGKGDSIHVDSCLLSCSTWALEEMRGCEWTQYPAPVEITREEAIAIIGEKALEQTRP